MTRRSRVGKKCEIQETMARVCGKRAVATWNWGGPTLHMCKGHDDRMRQHVAGCQDCKQRIRRTHR